MGRARGQPLEYNILLRLLLLLGCDDSFTLEHARNKMLDFFFT